MVSIHDWQKNQFNKKSFFKIESSQILQNRKIRIDRISPTSQFLQPLRTAPVKIPLTLQLPINIRSWMADAELQTPWLLPKSQKPLLVLSPKTDSVWISTGYKKNMTTLKKMQRVVGREATEMIIDLGYRKICKKKKVCNMKIKITTSSNKSRIE